MKVARAAPSPVDGAAPALLGSIDLPGGTARLRGFMVELLDRVDPGLLGGEGAADSCLPTDPRVFAAVTSGAFDRVAALADSPRRHREVDGIGIEPLTDPAAWPHFQDPGTRLDRAASAVVPPPLRDGMGRALAVIADGERELHDALIGTVRTVVTFSGSRPYSFASLRAHGAVFLSWRRGDGHPYLLEELSHQGGHVLLTAALFEREHELFTVAPSTPLRRLGIDDNEEGRDLLVLFHAVFTEALMLVALNRGLEDPGATAVERHEIAGRMLLTSRRFAGDLRDLCRVPVLSELGTHIVARAASVLAAIAEPILAASALDLSGQPYAFDRATFLERNPIPT